MYEVLSHENIHLDVMQLVTGATARSNIINVLDEFGGYAVSDNIKHATLTILFKVVRRKTPQVLDKYAS